MSNSSEKSNQGFTIIEMVVSVAIGMLILWVALSLFYYQRKSFTVQEQLSEMQQNLRAAMDMMSREIRMAGYGTTSTNVVTVSDTGTITFSYDSDNDGDLEQITFDLDQGDLQITRNTQPIAENIEALSFTYGNTSSGATDTVTIAITARTDKTDPNYTGDGYRRGTLTSTVKLRNQ